MTKRKIILNKEEGEQFKKNADNQIKLVNSFTLIKRNNGK